MLVYVVSKEGLPLMPCKPATARHLLKKSSAKVVKRTPFTIQLNFECENKVQDVVLGVDTGYKHIGLSAVSNNKELFSAEVNLRTDIPKLLSEKRQYRRTKRNRLWYSKPRFLNRRKSDGWLAPSIQHKLDSHIKAINEVKKILPISEIIVEVADFDIQKIKNPDIQGKEYQNGEQKDFWNVREYVLYRDNHTCQACGKSNTILNVHHIKPRSNGGTNKPDNLITLCESCHKAYHAGKLKIKIPKPSKEFKAETFMSMVRWKIVDILKELGNTVTVTYGYLTKSKRISLGLEKTHYNDAFCITGGENQERNTVYIGKQTRRNNRAIQLNRKGFKPSVRKQRYIYQPNDLVKFAGILYFVKGVQSLGKYIKLAGLKNPVKTELVRLVKYGKGLQFNY